MDKFTVRDASGEVDVVASATQYGEALAAWVAENELPSEQLHAAVNAVFDRFPGQTIVMPALLSLCVVELGSDPSSHKRMTQQLRVHIRGLETAGVLSVTKGKGGGVARLADKKETEESDEE